MSTSSVICDVFSFFATRKCQKIEKSIKIVIAGKSKSSDCLNDLRDFNEIFRKNMA